jgi:3-methyladenine DNA glycosylase AlkD
MRDPFGCTQRPMKSTAIAVEVAAALQTLRQPTTPAARDVRRTFSRRLRAAPGSLVLDTAVKLVARGGDLERFVAYELVSSHRAARCALTSRRLLRLGKGVASWGAVDSFASYLAGPAWREGQIPTALVQRWARSSDRWWRRAALVSTVPLNNKARGRRGDAKRTLAICGLLVADRDDLVVKALSWALRELAKRDSAAVRTFLQRHQALLAPRIRREVLNKLTTGLKAPRRRGAA